jgi:hypothetical protein
MVSGLSCSVGVQLLLLLLLLWVEVMLSDCCWH